MPTWVAVLVALGFMAAGVVWLGRRLAAGIRAEEDPEWAWRRKQAKARRRATRW